MLSNFEASWSDKDTHFAGSTGWWPMWSPSLTDVGSVLVPCLGVSKPHWNSPTWRILGIPASRTIGHCTFASLASLPILWCFSVCSVQDKDIEHNHLFKGIKNGTLHGLVTIERTWLDLLAWAGQNNMISDDLSLIWEILRDTFKRPEAVALAYFMAPTEGGTAHHVQTTHYSWGNHGPCLWIYRFQYRHANQWVCTLYPGKVRLGRCICKLPWSKFWPWCCCSNSCS